jgi:hypothetical protein
LGQSKIPLYSLINLLALLVGYFITTIVVIFSSAQQPALIYASILQIVSNLLVSFFRKNIRQFWTGERTTTRQATQIQQPQSSQSGQQRPN